MDTPRVWVTLTGPPGAGKTTLARLLAGRYERAAHIESDRFFRFIASGYLEPWRTESHGQNKVVMASVGEAAAGYARGGYFTIVDGILVPGWFLEPIRDSLRSANVDVSLTILRPPLATALQRTRERGFRPPERSRGHRATLERLQRSRGIGTPRVRQRRGRRDANRGNDRRTSQPCGARVRLMLFIRE